MLDRQKHERVLKSILRDIYTSPDLRGQLAFKGGTCLYLFYGLDRFSVDLDFNLVAENFPAHLMTELLTTYLTLDEQISKHFTWFWSGSYERGGRHIKIEVSKRDFPPDTYVTRNFYGLTVLTMAPDCMFAHKLCAITDRPNLQHRDLYDAHFMFTKQFPINEKIVSLRTGKTLKEYLAFAASYIEKNVKPGNILDGLGELLDEKQKEMVKRTLLTNILFDLRSY
jgi:predicted nucleotidyltransferase component of viral defense system